MGTVKFRVELLEEMLGTASANPELYEEFIASKCAAGGNEDEAQTLPDVEESIQKGTTVFHRLEDGSPFVYDYQIKGFFKDACSMMNRYKPKKYQVRAYKKVIDGLIFPAPRKIKIELPEGGEVGICQRPLRAQTAQGERVSLARSESVPAGSVLRFEVTCLDDSIKSHLLEWMKYGELRGLGQWRNSGKGRFTFVEEE